MRKRLAPTSDAEGVVLRVLWQHGPARVRDLLATLPEDQWAYTTVQTLLHRLRDKGYVDRAQRDGVSVYRAKVTRDELLQHRLRDLTRELADGSVLNVVHGLVDGEPLSRAEIAEMRALLDRLEPSAPEQSKTTRPRRRRRTGGS